MSQNKSLLFGLVFVLIFGFIVIGAVIFMTAQAVDSVNDALTAEGRARIVAFDALDRASNGEADAWNKWASSNADIATGTAVEWCQSRPTRQGGLVEWCDSLGQ